MELKKTQQKITVASAAFSLPASQSPTHFAVQNKHFIIQRNNNNSNNNNNNNKRRRRLRWRRRAATKCQGPPNPTHPSRTPLPPTFCLPGATTQIKATKIPTTSRQTVRKRERERERDGQRGRELGPMPHTHTRTPLRISKKNLCVNF